MVRNHALIVLEALLQGEREIGGYVCGDGVRIGDHEWVLAAGGPTPVLCIVAERQRGDMRERTLLGQPEMGTFVGV